MRDCWIEVLRLRIAALVRIFTRTFSFFRHGALPRELSCGVFPLGVLQACSTEFLAHLSPESARFCSVCGTRFTLLVVYTPNSFAQRCSSVSVVLPNLVPRRNLASVRPCQVPSLPPRTSSPLLGTVSLNNPQTLSSCCLSRDTFHHPACLTNHGHTSMEVSLRSSRVSNSKRKHRI